MTTTVTAREPLEAGQSVRPELDLGTLLQILRQRRRVIALWVAIMIGAAVLYLLVTPKVYEAKTVALIEQNERPVVSRADLAPEALATPEVLKTFEQNFDSGALLLRVAKTNHLYEDPRFLAEQSGILGTLKQGINRVLTGNSGGPPSDAKMIREMDSRTVVKLRRGTRLVDVSVRAQDPSLAVELSRSLVDEYMKLDVAQKATSARPAYDYLLSEADRLKEKLQKSEQALQTYKEEQQSASLENSQNIVVEMLKSMNTSLSDARAVRLKLESDYARLQASEERPSELLSLPTIAASPDVQALKQRISEMEGILASLSQRYTTKSPRYLEAESELKKLNLSLEKVTRDAAGVIKSSYIAAKDTEDKLSAALQEQEKHALELNRIAIHYNVLSREVESDQALYQAVLTQLKEAQIVQGGGNGSVRIVEPATLPDKPAWPKKSIVLLAAVFLGLVFGNVAAVGPVLVRSPLTGVADAEAQLGVPVLGAIPKARGRRGPQKVFLLDNPRSPAAESIRSLRAVLLPWARHAQSKTILFASAVAGEGKSFCALNTAAALALDGQRTLFIESDLRSPSIGAQLFDKKALPGVVDVLSDRARFKEAVQPSKVKNLDILTAGGATDTPSELLGSNKLAELLAEASLAYEYIILDSAALLEASDGLRLARCAKTVCLVARAGKTPGRSVARALHLLATAESGASVGLVLNEFAGREG